jgi:hypothetical protein
MLVLRMRKEHTVPISQYNKIAKILRKIMVRAGNTPHALVAGSGHFAGKKS